MRLHIHGLGACALGFDQAFEEDLGAFEEIPIKAYAKASRRRRFGRLARLVYVAASRAIEAARVADPEELLIVLSTAMGETTVSVDLLTQIHESKGVMLRPSLVPNSVHNSPAGYLAIGLGNHRPSITVSQGWLSGEAGLSAAADLLNMDGGGRALVIAGDEANPAWVERLAEAGAGQWSEKLAAQRFQEGVVALVLGTEPGPESLGTVVSDTTRGRPDTEGVAGLLDRNGIAVSQGAEVRVRAAASGEAIRKAVGSALGRAADQVHLDGPGLGTSQAGAFAILGKRLQDPACDELLLVGAEVDEIALVHWTR